MARNIRVNYVELPAADFAAIETFYRDAFGWSFTSFGPEYHAFNDGAFDGGFYRSELVSRQDNGSTLIVLLSDDLQHSYDAVVSNGGRIHKEIFSFPGGSRFHFLDPHGNELSVWTMTDGD
ncbi:MAG: VOC family protein [Pseudomonadota bacterium]